MSETDKRSAASPASWTAIAGLVLIFGFLSAGGANSASLAALQGMLLALLAGAACLAASPGRMERAWAQGVLPFAALAGLVVYSVASGLSVGLLAPHPLWADFGLPDGASSISPFRTFEGVASLAGPVCAYAAVALCLTSGADRDRFFAGVLILALAFGVYALGLYAAGGGVRERLSVNFGSANSAATLFSVVFLISTAGVMRAWRKASFTSAVIPTPLRPLALAYKSPLAVSAFVLSLTCLLLTASRGGQLATAGAFVLLLAMLGLGSRRGGAMDGSRIALLFLAFAAAMVVFAGGTYAFRRFDTAADDMEVREVMIGAHYAAFEQRPVTGHGLNTFHELNSLQATPDNWFALKGTGSAHNIFVQLLEETGWIGAGLMALVLIGPVLRTASAAFRREPGSEWAAASLAALVACLMHGLVDFGLQTPAVAALLAACLGAFGQAPQSSRSRSRRP